MKLFKTVRLIFDREINTFIVVDGISIVAHTFEEAEAYCEFHYPKLVVYREEYLYKEDLQVGEFIYTFNYN